MSIRHVIQSAVPNFNQLVPGQLENNSLSFQIDFTCLSRLNKEGEGV